MKKHKLKKYFLGEGCIGRTDEYKTGTRFKKWGPTMASKVAHSVIASQNHQPIFLARGFLKEQARILTTN